jgi:hypothetical protein
MPKSKNEPTSIENGDQIRSNRHFARLVHHSDIVLAVAWCALSARCEGRGDDYQFWFGVFRSLQTEKK